MDVFTVSNLINCIVVMVAYGIKSELSHINENIKSVKELVDDAKAMAHKAHERIDFFLEHRQPK